MDKVARLPAVDRAALFNQTGAARGLSNMIIEKDFWACWTLKRLFSLTSDGAPGLIFKGGTSLSKVYGAIRRFSEDIDLSIDRKGLGYHGKRAPEEATTNQANKLLKELNEHASNHVKTVLLPQLNHVIGNELGSTEWTLAIDAKDEQSINFQYPSCLDDPDYASSKYISPRVQLQFGAKGYPGTTEWLKIQPYSAEDFPQFFESPTCSVHVLQLPFTFWEKATALHVEYHRKSDSKTPANYSRHYFDLAMLADREDGKAAIKDIALLKQVAEHKSVFYRSASAKYDTARPGTLRLTPHSSRISDLRRDYREMQEMIFDDPAPSFDDIMKRIEALEQLINRATA